MQSSLGVTTVAVIGLGRVGLALAVHYARSGCRVFGCDSDPQVITTLSRGETHMQREPELAEAVAMLVQNGQLSVTQDTIVAVRHADVVIVIVPVSLTIEHKTDFSAIDNATAVLARGLQAGTLVIYETTLPVGITRTRLAPLLEERSGLYAGVDFYLACSPELVSSSSVFHDPPRYPKVVGGLNAQSTAAAEAFYHRISGATVIAMASTDEAEFVKLIETTYHDVNIALANEYARYADTHGLNIEAAIAAANAQPYAHIHTPGVGVGGHCIPVHPYFLFANPLEQLPETALRLARSARSINDDMATYAVERLQGVLGPLRGLSVLLLGVACRGDVRETAFSTAVLLQKALLQQGARVYADDPLYSEAELKMLGYTPLTRDIEAEIVALVLQAAHSAYQRFDVLRFEQCRVVLDGRNALEGERDRLAALGVRYLTIGDGEFRRSEALVEVGQL